jgi:hypothetical protein
MANRVVRLDNVAATKVPSLIKSAKYMGADGATATKIENGRFVVIGGLMDGEREVHVAKDVAETDTMVGLVCTPEVLYDEKKDSLMDFINEAGEVIRVMLLQKGDIFSVADDTTANDKADETVGVLTAKYIQTEVCGRLTYKVMEIQ